jgi:hypothetical protein
MASHDNSLRGLWAAIIVIGAFMIATLTVGVFWSAGVQLPGALGAGGAAFFGTATLGITIRGFLTH